MNIVVCSFQRIIIIGRVRDVSYVWLLHRSMSQGDFPTYVTLVPWFMVILGETNQSEQINKTLSFADELVKGKDKKYIYFLYSCAEKWGTGGDFAHGHYVLIVLDRNNK